jgi:hypothetical protein
MLAPLVAGGEDEVADYADALRFPRRPGITGTLEITKGGHTLIIDKQ